MIPKSTMYAAVEGGVVIAKGSAKDMTRLVKALAKAERIVGRQTAQVWNSPSARVGDRLPRTVTP